MINLAVETLLSLAQAARKLPGGRAGKSLDPSTVWRWCTIGIRRDGQIVKLESARLGGRFVTSVEALQRFSDALGADFTNEAQSTPPLPRTPTKRRAASEQASRRLEEAGV